MTSRYNRFDFLTSNQAERNAKNHIIAFSNVISPVILRSNRFLSVKFLTNTQRKFNDHLKNGSGAILTVNTLIAIPGDLVAEHFNKETKGRASHFPSGYISDHGNGL